MPKEIRGSIVSVRLSADEQERLREKAESRGVTVSELLRKTALSEIRLDTDTDTTTTTHSTPTVGGIVLADGYGSPRPGVVWSVPEGALAQGANLTL